MNILLIGQTSLDWGRMEFGNIGNYYVIEPLIRLIHKTFPGCKINTTLQMSEAFCNREKVNVLPLNLYYGRNIDNLSVARQEVELASHPPVVPCNLTPYMEAVLAADLVIDYSGDMWGDNADVADPDRFEVGLLKDLTVQLLGKKIVMLAGSPGPFSSALEDMAKKVFARFDLVTNREPISSVLLEEWGFDMSKTHWYPCPSFLFESDENSDVHAIFSKDGVDTKRPLVGMILCGWNFKEGPFSKWPRSDTEFETFARLIEELTNTRECGVVLMSHSNGFPIPPKEFKLIHGRDYPIIKQLQQVLNKRGIAKNVYALNGIYDAYTTKNIIGHFDMLVSGRVHGAIAGISQNLPTCIIDYGHEPKAHKLLGFAKVAQLENLLCDPNNFQSMKESVFYCFDNRDEIRQGLERRIPNVKIAAEEGILRLRSLMD